MSELALVAVGVDDVATVSRLEMRDLGDAALPAVERVGALVNAGSGGTLR